MILINVMFINVLRKYLAEEVGVEPTSHLNSSSTALKAARPTGSDALPSTMVTNLTVARHELVLDFASLLIAQRPVLTGSFCRWGSGL